MEYFKLPEFSDEPSSEADETTFGSETNFADTSNEVEQFEAEVLQGKEESRRRRKVDYSHFDSTQFNEVDSLLTNVEDYTKRIREDAEKYVRRVREEIDIKKSEIELELAGALIKKLESEAKGQQVIESAEQARSTAQSNGWEEGFQTGYAEGFAKFSEENKMNTGNILALTKELQDLRANIFLDNELEILKLSQLIAKKIVHNELKTEKSFILETLKATVVHFEGLGNIRIRLHPLEYEFVKAHQPEIEMYLDEDQIVKIKPDSNIQPATSIIESDFAEVNLNINKQFEEIEMNIMDCFNDRKPLFKPKS